jgi:hypothetical protein
MPGRETCSLEVRGWKVREIAKANSRVSFDLMKTLGGGAKNLSHSLKGSFTRKILVAIDASLGERRKKKKTLCVRGPVG